MSSTPRFDRFVTAVHRRAVMMRVLEGLGGGLMFAAAFCLLGQVLEMSKGARWATFIFPTLAAVFFGISLGWRQRPTRLAAVIEADRQLKLDDLLSSALTARDDAFGQTVRAMAERACGQISPSQVILNRFGVRAWGGVGLAWATVIVLGLLAGNGVRSEAGNQSPTTANSTAANSADRTSTSADPLATAEKGVDEARNAGPTDVEASPTGQSGKVGSNAGDASTGSGGGQARSDSGGGNPAEVHPTTGSKTSPNGQPSGGAGSAASGGGPDAAGGLGSGSSDHSAAPWHSDHWPSDRATALQSVRDGRLPDAYRDLVRDYFEPNGK